MLAAREMRHSPKKRTSNGIPPAAKMASAPFGTTTTRQPSRFSIVSRTLVTIGFLPATRQSIVARRFAAAGTDDDIGDGEDDVEMPKGALIGAGASGAEDTIGIAGESAPGIWSGGSDSIRDGGEDESNVSV